MAEVHRVKIDHVIGVFTSYLTVRDGKDIPVIKYKIIDDGEKAIKTIVDGDVNE